jgi:hypothetical protein
MFAKAIFLVISACILGAQATWEDKPTSWNEEDKPTSWNEEDKPTSWDEEDKPTSWNEEDEGAWDEEDTAELFWDSDRGIVVEPTEGDWAEWLQGDEDDKDDDDDDETAELSGAEEEEEEEHEDGAHGGRGRGRGRGRDGHGRGRGDHVGDGRGRGRGRDGEGERHGGRGRGRDHREEDHEDDDEHEGCGISGIIALSLGDPNASSAFAADSEARNVVRAVLAEVASVAEENVVVRDMKAARRLRRLTTAEDRESGTEESESGSEEGIVAAMYKIRVPRHQRRNSFAIVAAIQNNSANVLHLCQVHLQRAGLPYTVARVRLGVRASSQWRPKEGEPCEPSEGHLRGSHRHGDCGHSDDQDSPVWLQALMVLGTSLLITVCVGICVRRRNAKRRQQESQRQQPTQPSLIVVGKPAQVEGNACNPSNANTEAPTKGTEEGIIAGNNAIAMGIIVPEEPPKKDALAHL